MHETHVLRDLLRKIEETAGQENAYAVRRIAVRVGVLSHFTPEHFREHFADASRGTVAEGALVDVDVDADPRSPFAQGVVLEAVELVL